MTLKKKILTGYGVAFALMGLVVAAAVTNLISLGKASDAILSENYRSILAAENMVDTLERQDSALLIVLLGDKEKGSGQFKENQAAFHEWLARAMDNITIPGEDALVRSIQEDFRDHTQKCISLIQRNGLAGMRSGFADYQKNIYPLFAKIRQSCIDLRLMNEKTMYDASTKAAQLANRAVGSTITLAASVLVAGLVFSLFLAGRIVKPVKRFIVASRKIASGDYDVKVPVESGDELGGLAGEFNKMAARIHEYNEMNIEHILAERSKGEAIIASIEDGLLLFDTELYLTILNPAARQILGIEKSEISSLRCADIFRDTSICQVIQNTVETGLQPLIPDENRIIAIHDGDRLRQVLYTVTRIHKRDGNLSGIVVLLRDLTRLKDVEQLKNEFIMAASHELRTPLTSLGMSIDLLVEHAKPDLSIKDRELLEAAHEEVHRIKTLVRDLLDLFKIEGGRIQMEFETVQIPVLFEHIRKVFKGQSDLKEISLDSEIPTNLPAVRADANKITWVLSNLISNALRYTGKGGHIKVLARGTVAHVNLSVQDDGPGIPLAYQSKIFKKFVQIKGRESGGTGLGLAICKEIINAHGGSIWVESSPGQGSTFTFTLPVNKQEE